MLSAEDMAKMVLTFSPSETWRALPTSETTQEHKQNLFQARCGGSVIVRVQLRDSFLYGNGLRGTETLNLRGR